MNLLPKARNKNIIMQDLGNEILIYDTTADKAYCLNETSAKVFHACDGKQTFAELKSRYKYTDDLIFFALDELKAKNLLDSAADYQSPFAGINRREVIRKVGLASMIALPIITGIVAPTAANAASGAAATCTPNATGCFPTGSNTNVPLGANADCPQACSSAPFARSCCTCAIQFALPIGGGNCFCSCS